MSGTYQIVITLGSTLIFSGSFVVDITQLPNIIEFYEDGNPNNILAPTESWINSNNAFISKSNPFSYDGTSITTMSYYPGNYGSNTTDSTYNFYGNYSGEAVVQSIRNFSDNSYTFTVTGGPLTPPFPRDTSIPPACFYNMQGLSMYLNQNILFKTYYADTNLFPYLTFYADNIYPEAGTTYDVQNVPLPPLLSNLSQLQAQQYNAQLELFRKVYDYNYAAYYNMAYRNPNGNPIYYRFATASELSEFREAAALVNKLYNVNAVYPLQCIFFLPFPPFCNDTA